MEAPVTWTQLIIAVIFVLVTTLSPQMYSIYKQKQESKTKEREDKLREKQMEIDAEETTWKRVISEYERTIERAHKLEQENEQLRPLALQNAVLEQKMKQCKEDKEDWKSHSEKLEVQLQENNIVPVPFKRNPREDTGQQLKTVSRKMKAIKDTHATETNGEGSPTLIFPPATTTREGEK